MKNHAQRSLWTDIGGFLGGVIGISNNDSPQPPANITVQAPAQDNTMIYVMFGGIALLIYFMGGKK